MNPADPGGDPYPSVFVTPEFTGVEDRANARRSTFNQCCYEGPRPKLTTVSSTFDDVDEMDGVLCPGVSDVHQHFGKSEGRNAEG